MPDKDPVPTGGDFATRTDSHSIPFTSDHVHEETAKDHRSDAYVESAVDVAKASGDPYFNEYADDPDDDRADTGVRVPRDIDAREEQEEN